MGKLKPCREERGVDLKRCLDFDMFDGDFGDQSDLTLSNKLVTAKKAHTCNNCLGRIEIGELYRHQVCKIDGEIMSYRWCKLCCEAMLLDDPSNLYDRCDNRNRRAGERKEGENENHG